MSDVRDDLALLREPGVFNWSARRRGLAALARVEAELARLQKLVVAHHALGAMDGLEWGGTCPVCARALLAGATHKEPA